MQSIFEWIMESATLHRRPLRAPSRPARLLRRCLALCGAGFLLAAAGVASGETIPGPPLDVPAAEPGAFCAPQSGQGGLGGAGFASAVAAIAFVARRRRDTA
jgi:hypothetical protein